MTLIIVSMNFCIQASLYWQINLNMIFKNSMLVCVTNQNKMAEQVGGKNLLQTIRVGDILLS